MQADLLPLTAMKGILSKGQIDVHLPFFKMFKQMTVVTKINCYRILTDNYICEPNK